MVDLDELKFEINESWREAQKNDRWRVHIPAFARDSYGNEYMNPVGSNSIYRVVKEIGNDLIYRCAKCDGNICGVNVEHLILDGSLNKTQHINALYEKVPYCSKCEEAPNLKGDPIIIGPVRSL